MENVNSVRILAPPWWPLPEGRDGKCERRNEKCEFLARESVSSSPIVWIFGKGKCKFIANFSATMVTSLPSISLSLSLSLSLSPKVPHAQYRKRFRASYNRKRGSASYIVREVLSVREREREIQRERRKWRHQCRAKIGNEFTLSLPKVRTIGDELTLSLTKNSHSSPFTLPVSPFTERSPLWRWNSQWVHTFHSKIFFALFVPPLSNGTSRATSDRKLKTNDQILPSPIFFFPSQKWIKLIPKTIGNRKRDCAWGGSGW